MDIDYLKKIQEPVFFVTNDINRGIGLENVLPNFHLICLDDHVLVDYLRKKSVSVFCLEKELGKKNILARSSGLILGHPLVLDFIKKKSKGKTANILFFKPQRKIELVAQEKKFKLLGNPLKLNDFFEDKVSFFEICQKEKIKTPPGEICFFSDLDFPSLNKKYQTPLVIQLGHGWAGNSTFFISNKEELERLKKEKSLVNKKVKVGSFIKGKTLINNAVVYQNQVLISQPALQINAHPVLTSYLGGTGGRQWPVLLNREQKNKINAVTRKVGRIMKEKGFKGFFGLDFLLEEQTGEVFLSECNARLTASTSFYTKLELENCIFPLLGFHLLSFLGDNSKEEVVYNFKNSAGSEIIARNTQKVPLTVKKELVSGIYDKDYNFIKAAYCLNTGKEGHFWLSAAGKERQVNPEIELLRVCTREKVADELGNLKPEFLHLISWAKDKLKLKEC